MTTYQQIYDLKQAVESRGTPRIYQRLQAQLNAELSAAYKAVHPRAKKFDNSKIWKEMPETYMSILDRYKPIQKQLTDGYYNIVDEAKATLKRLAPTVDLTPQPEMQRCYVASTDSYRSQGFGCQHYAEMDAEDHAEDVRRHGFTAEVRRVNVCTGRDNYGHSYSVDNYEVWANCTAMQADACKYLPGRSVKEWAKWCINHGVSPRVYAPFLPADIADGY